MKFKYKIRYCIQFVRQFLIIYRYDSARYANSFLCKTAKTLEIELRDFEEIIYCFWTGTNEMTENRKRCFEVLVAHADVAVKLITPDNLNNYILEQHPLHPAFQYLSAVHKSDYLRCYFMHFYGGGYSDIKACPNSWKSAFKELQQGNKWIIGYGEVRKKDIAQLGDVVGKDLAANFTLLLGNCAYICRPNTSFTKEWYAELQSRMDVYHKQLSEFPGNIMGDNVGYPIPWTNILGDIFHPLCLKYHEKTLQTNEIKPVVSNYR